MPVKLISSKLNRQIKYTRTQLIDNLSLRKITVALAAISKPSIKNNIEHSKDREEKINQIKIIITIISE